MRIIDADPFDKFIIHVPEGVGDEYSYIRGVEDMLELIRKAETIYGGKYSDVTFTHRGEKVDNIPKAEITNNGDVVFHCGSVEEARWFVAVVGCWYDVFNSGKVQKTEDISAHGQNNF